MEICTIYVLLLCTLCLIRLSTYWYSSLNSMIANLLIFFNVSFFKVWQRRVVSGSYFLMHEFYVREDALSIHNQCDIGSNVSNCISKTMYNVYVTFAFSSLKRFMSSFQNWFRFRTLWCLPPYYRKCEQEFQCSFVRPTKSSEYKISYNTKHDVGSCFL